jgi:nitrous oxidase accessory protein NosD
MSNFTSAAILCSHCDVLTGGPDVDRYPYYFTDNLVIRNNTISGALNFGMGGRTFAKDEHETGAIETYGGHGHGRRGIGVGDLRLARNFDITGNTIKNSGSTGIHIANTVGVNIAGNTILNPNLLSEHNRFGIWVEASSDVTVEDNKVEGANVEQAVKIEP